MRAVPVFVAMLLLVFAGCSTPPPAPAERAPAPGGEAARPPTKYVNASLALSVTNPPNLAWPGETFGFGRHPTDCGVVSGDGRIANGTDGRFTFTWEAQTPALAQMRVEVFTGEVTYLGDGEHRTLREATGPTGLAVPFRDVDLRARDRADAQRPPVHLYAWITPLDATGVSFEQAVQVAYSLPFESGPGGLPPQAAPALCTGGYMPVPKTA